MKRPVKKWTPVIVTWRDAVTVREEMHSEADIDDATPVVRKSIGFLLKANRKEVIICMEDDREKRDPDSDCQTVTGIPRGMVESIAALCVSQPAS